MGHENAGLHSGDPLAPSKEPLDPLGESLDLLTAKSGVHAPMEPIADKAEVPSVSALRRMLRLTQSQFAGMFGFPLATLKHWERGNRRPTGSALVLLFVIHENPRVVRTAVRKARMWRPGLLPNFVLPKSYRASPGFGQRPPPRRPRGARRGKIS